MEVTAMKKTLILLFLTFLLLLIACRPVERVPERIIIPEAPPVPAPVIVAVPEEVEPGTAEDLGASIAEATEIDQDLSDLDDLDAELAALEDLI